MGFWTDNALAQGLDKYPHIIVDCGYLKHPLSRKNADRLLAAMGCSKRGHIEIVGFGRLLVRVPPKKATILKRFRSIRNEAGYSWTTHTYGKGKQFDIRFHG